ncbi:alpha/beta hydrolase family [Lentimicrobium saccharophilum]|uniref:Alpha/beta hydrolase family n=1 Tax=Lentimicrobium saccharophilum TaxID=1678841 RepID=A0A0S7C035_9BACT|nr:PHB depolymerase family esterase [Lentimicrobium saccharophilum]GAP43297.1 alpha/beta hydrolase family [Lentimicrobium saccharophilum]
MKNFSVILLLLLLAGIGTQAQTVLHEGSFTGTVIRQVSLDYLLYLPDNYNSEKDKTWPLLIFLHGSGERGNDPEKIKVHGPPKLIEAGQHFPFMVLSPQCPDKRDWDAETIYALVKNIAGRYRVDENRIYVTGLSMGGWAAWDLAMAYPGYFAAIAPVCGRIDRNYPRRADELKSMPVWAFHGAADDVVPVTDAAKMIRLLQDAGGNARITIYPGANHDSWTETYNNPELYEWLLKQSRP